MIRKILFLSVLCGLSYSTWAQDDLDLLDELGEDSTEVNYATASYKASRIINSISLENTAEGVLDLRISHRFGALNTGVDEFFGLDNAVTRIGFDYGLTPWLMIGVGRSTYEKAYDGFFKAKILRQSTGAKNMPVSLQFFSSMMINSLKAANPDQDLFTSRMGYTFQAIVGRKINKGTTIQLMPTLVHRNFVETRAESNDVFVLGIGGRQKFSRRAALTYEFHYVLPDQLAPQYVDYSFSVGVDIETGGHVFQLFLTNSAGMNEQQFLTQNTGDWADGDIRIGFNISRVFTVKKPK
ncbi:hypothetical protein KFE94_10470 [bacterium SCSIO 12643]|nr:hypothetical protein KFE94_10470 [bacterium SCSIO 12643]